MSSSDPDEDRRRTFWADHWSVPIWLALAIVAIIAIALAVIDRLQS